MKPYTEMLTVPAYTQAEWKDGKPINDEAELRWGGKEGAPPAIGEKITITINGIGPAVVTGYFTLDGWLGVLAQPDAAPAWYIKQNGGNKPGGVFGTEFKKQPQEQGAQ